MLDSVAQQVGKDLPHASGIELRRRVKCLENDGALYTNVHRRLAREASQGVDGTPRRVPLENMKRFAVEYRRAARLAAVLLAHVKD